MLGEPHVFLGVRARGRQQVPTWGPRDPVVFQSRWVVMDTCLGGGDRAPRDFAPPTGALGGSCMSPVLVQAAGSGRAANGCFQKPASACPLAGCVCTWAVETRVASLCCSAVAAAFSSSASWLRPPLQVPSALCLPPDPAQAPGSPRGCCAHMYLCSGSHVLVVTTALFFVSPEL